VSHIVRMGESEYKVVIRTPTGNGPLGIPRTSINIKRKFSEEIVANFPLIQLGLHKNDACNNSVLQRECFC
jgi:hypothetical protein